MRTLLTGSLVALVLALTLLPLYSCTQITSEKGGASSDNPTADWGWDERTCWGDDGEVCPIDTAAWATTEEVFKIVEEYPEFPGGEEARLSFIEENFHFPSAELCVSGRIIVHFVVERDGRLINVEILRGLHEELDQEALRVVRLMPRWTPGKISGQAVRTEFIIPIEFRL